MKRKTLFKLKGVVSLIVAFTILIGSFFIPTVKLTVNDFNGRENDGTLALSINTIIELEKQRGASDKEIAEKYGKYLETAEKEYELVNEITKESLISESSVLFVEWANRENFNFANLKPSVFDEYDLTDSEKEKFCYYLINSYQEELKFIEQTYYIKDSTYGEREEEYIKVFLENRNPLKNELKYLLYSTKTISDYKTELQNQIEIFRIELKKLLDNRGKGYDSGSEYSYSFNAPSSFQLLTNISNIKNFLDLVSQEKDIYDKKIEKETNETKLNLIENLKGYYIVSSNEEIDALINLGYEIQHTEQAGVDEAQAEIKNLEDYIKEFSAVIKRQEGIRNAAQAEIRQLDSFVSQLVSAKNTEIANLKAEIKVLEDTITEDGVRESIEAKNAEIEVAQAEINYLTKYNSVLELVKAKNAEIEAAEEVIGLFEYFITEDGIRESINAKNTEIANLQSEIKQLEDSITEDGIRESINAKNAEIANLQSEIKQLENLINLVEKYGGVQNVIDVKHTEIEEAEAEIRQLDDFITEGSIRDFIDAKNAEIEAELGRISLLEDFINEFIELKNEQGSTADTTQDEIDKLNELTALLSEYDGGALELINVKNAEIEAAQAEIRQLASFVDGDSVQDLIDAKNTEIANLQAEINRLSSIDKEGARELIDAYNSQIDSTQNEIDKLNALKNSISEYGGVQEFKNAKNAEIKAAQEKIKQLENSITLITADSVQELINAKKDKDEVSQEEIKQLENLKNLIVKNGSAWRLLNAENNDIDSIQNEIDKLNALINWISEYDGALGFVNAKNVEIETAQAKINKLDGFIYETSLLKQELEKICSDAETKQNAILSLNNEIQEIEDYVEENFEKFANSINDVSFEYAAYYRQQRPDNMEADSIIARTPELYYELYFGIVHTYGVDIKTVSLLSYGISIIAALVIVYFIIETLIKTIVLLSKKESVYKLGISSFVKAMTVFGAVGIATAISNSLTWGAGTFSVVGLIFVILCAGVIALNFVDGRSNAFKYYGKKAINLIQIFSVIEMILLSVALGIFMIGNTNPFISATYDFVSYKRFIPISFLWAIASMFIIVVMYLDILKSLQIVGMCKRKLGNPDKRNTHVSDGFKINFILAALICLAVMLFSMFIFVGINQSVLWKLIVLIVLTGATLAARIVQNKLLNKRFPTVMLSDMSEIVSAAYSAPRKDQEEDKVHLYF